MPIRPRFCCFTVFFNFLVHNMSLRSRMSMKTAVFVYFNFWFGIIKVVTERPEAWIHGDHLSIKIPFYQYRDSHHKDKMVSQPSYIGNEKFHPSIVFTLRRGPRSLMGVLTQLCAHQIAWVDGWSWSAKCDLDFCLALWFLTEVNVFRSEMCILVL